MRVYLDLNTGDLMIDYGLVALPNSFAYLFQTDEHTLTVYIDIEDLVFLGYL